MSLAGHHRKTPLLGNLLFFKDCVRTFHYVISWRGMCLVRWKNSNGYSLEMTAWDLGSSTTWGWKSSPIILEAGRAYMSVILLKRIIDETEGGGSGCVGWWGVERGMGNGEWEMVWGDGGLILSRREWLREGNCEHLCGAWFWGLVFVLFFSWRFDGFEATDRCTWEGIGCLGEGGIGFLIVLGRVPWMKVNDEIKWRHLLYEKSFTLLTRIHSITLLIHYSLFIRYIIIL